MDEETFHITDQVNDLEEVTNEIVLLKHSRCINLMVHFSFLLCKIVDKLQVFTFNDKDPTNKLFKKTIIYAVLTYKIEIHKLFLKLEPTCFNCQSNIEFYETLFHFRDSAEELGSFEKLIDSPKQYFLDFKNDNAIPDTTLSELNKFFNTFLRVKRIHSKLLTFVNNKIIFEL